MKLINVFTVAMLAINVATASCSGVKNEASLPVAERTVTITDRYSGLTTSNGIVVEYTASVHDGNTICKITGPSELINRVKPIVQGSTLHIQTDDLRGLRNTTGIPITVSVSGRQLNNVEANSGSIVTLKSRLVTSGDMKLETGSGATLTMLNSGSLKCKNLTIDLHSGGILTVGNAQISGLLKIDASSGGILKISGKASTGVIEASSGTILTMNGMDFSGKVKVDASSGAIIKLPDTDAEITKDSGAIVNVSR